MTRHAKKVDQFPSRIGRQDASCLSRFDTVLPSADPNDHAGENAVRQEICELLMTCHRMAAYLREDELAERLIVLRLSLGAA